MESRICGHDGQSPIDLDEYRSTAALKTVALKSTESSRQRLQELEAGQATLRRR